MMEKVGVKPMDFIRECNDLNTYLSETDVVNYSNSVIQEKIIELFHPSQIESEEVKIAFEFVRDKIQHSWDIQSTQVTCNASEVHSKGEGICYAKSNALAALLRAVGIPAGFCYQRLMLFDKPEKGYCIHVLNAIYLKSLGKWIRLDSRGNKQGIDAQFSLEDEKLVFNVQEEFGEKDYPIIYVNPHDRTISILKEHTNALEMYAHHLLEHL